MLLITTILFYKRTLLCLKFILKGKRFNLVKQEIFTYSILRYESYFHVLLFFKYGKQKTEK